MLKVKTVYVLIVILKVLIGSILSYWLFKVQHESNTYSLMLTASLVALIAHCVSACPPFFSSSRTHIL